MRTVTDEGEVGSRGRISLMPRPAASTASAVLTFGLTVLSLMLAWFVFFTLVVSSLQHGHRQAVLYSELREELAMETAPLGGVIKPGAPIALMTFAAAGVKDEVIVEGTAAGDLNNGPGHKRDTPLPGQAGVSVVYGRANLFGGPFGDITKAHPGDRIAVVTGEGEAAFVVNDVRRAGDPFPVPLAAGGARLTLVTAEGAGWRSGWAPSRAVYVDATMNGTAFVTPPGRPSGVPKAEIAMNHDVSALYALVLWLPMLLFGLVGAVWAQLRWGRWQAWLVGLPVVLAGLWGVSETAVQLLPNLM
jgi:sortase A